MAVNDEARNAFNWILREWEKDLPDQFIIIGAWRETGEMKMAHHGALLVHEGLLKYAWNEITKAQVAKNGRWNIFRERCRFWLWRINDWLKRVTG